MLIKWLTNEERSEWKPKGVPTWFVIVTVVTNLAVAIPLFIWAMGAIERSVNASR